MKDEEILKVTAGRVREAAKTCFSSKQILETLFPEVFVKHLDGGQVYSWSLPGKNSNEGGYGIVVTNAEGDSFSFVNPHMGLSYSNTLDPDSTSEDLRHILIGQGVIQPDAKFLGPKYIKSWCYK